MRPVADAERIRALVRELARAAEQPTRLYLVGGATAVFLGWRETTVDVEPELFRYPAIDPPTFRHELEAALAATG